MCDVNTKEKTNGTRLRRLLLDGGTQTLRQLFDSIHPKSALPGVFKTHEVLLRRICRFDDQIELLFPPSGGQPDSKDFDITLLILLLSNICSLKKPTTGWKDAPSSSDKSKEANIVRVRSFRNKIQHLPSSEISDDQFEKFWNELAEPLKALGLPEDEINNLKDKPIDDISGIQDRWEKLCDHEQRIHNLEERFSDLKEEVSEQGGRIKKIEEQLQDKHETTKKSCIPDNPSRFIGREKELEEIIHAKTKDEKPFVMVYGMAGIGKSTLIKKASWDLVHKHDKTVYYIDLCRCKATEKDISKTINYKLFQGTKVENEPREALNIWARNLDQNVILVLDNAEDVLTTHEKGNHDAKSDFVKILLEVREFSAQKVNYLIASREALTSDTLHLTKKEINLTHFEEIESLKFIDFYLQEQDTHSSELTDLHKLKLIKLCCNIPLALQIVIPMLEDYIPDELTEKLQSKRSMEDILEPLKQALSLSFDKLNDTQRDYFLKLTIFPGYFTANSAKAILGVDKDDAVKTLKELSRRSLLQRENKKYSFHPFIHKFVVDYGETEANLKQHLLEEGKLNFLSHYEGLLLQNTEMYWTTDRCEKALSAFIEDRANFEKALEILLLVPDPVDLTKATMENTKRVVDKLSDVVMYLESCTSWDLLGRLLDKFIALAKDNNLPSRELESLCWKGHFARRQGDGEYEKLSEQADKLYESVPIDDNAKMCYKAAKGRFLCQKRKYEEGAKMFEEIKNFCKDKIYDNPRLNEDYARAIVELGHNLKHKDKYEEAVEKYKQGSTIYEGYLGQHIKTALSYKDIADGYLKQETPDDNRQALTYYNKAIDMLTMLKSDSEAHMILLLKNTGICLRNLGKHDESEGKFKKALSIAESKMRQQHKYKCRVKEELAYLYDDMGEKEKARSVAEEASNMAKKLKLTPADCFRDEKRLQNILRYP